MTFQTFVNAQQSPAVEGDFSSSNPRASVTTGESMFVAGATGAVVGNFGWADVNGLVTNVGAGAPTGFIYRNMQALITVFLGASTMTIPTGVPVTLFSQGEFWDKTATVATVGQKVFASNTDGTAKTGAAGATIAGYTETKWFVDSPAAVGELMKISTWG
jgi:hypothetical protein